MKPLRRDHSGNVGVVVALAVVGVVAVLLFAIFIAPSLPTGGPICTLRGTTTPTGVTVELRKSTGTDGTGRTVVASAVSSPTDGSYSVSTTCGGFFDAVASKPGYNTAMRQSLPFNDGPTVEVVDWALQPSVR